MKTQQELEQLFEITPERIAEIDADASQGILQGDAGKTVTGPGRPLLFDEVMTQVTFKEPQAHVQAMDARAQQLGMRRSDYLRQLVENDLKCAGVI